MILIKDKRFLWNNIAIFFGVLVVTIIAAKNVGLMVLVDPHRYGPSGFVIIIGSFAYRSAKKRKLGITKPSKIKMALELVAMFFVVRWGLSHVLYLFEPTTDWFLNYGISYIVVPVWITISYIVALVKTPAEQSIKPTV